ncbi:MAG: hypothetical protein ACTTJ1_08730 [Treponema sp.]
MKIYDSKREASEAADNFVMNYRKSAGSQKSLSLVSKVYKRGNYEFFQFRFSDEHDDGYFTVKLRR